MQILNSESLVNSQSKILDVFRDGYGEKYLGDEHFIQSYILQARSAVINDSFDSLGGAALIGKSDRITAVTTRSDREQYGSRFQGLISLLKAAQLAADDTWMGIGLDAHPAVSSAAEQAGMQRTQNKELVLARLERTNRLSRFALRRAATGFEISLAGSAHGSDYWSAVWGWETE